MATKAVTKSTKKQTVARNNPTLHGLLISPSFSGTVVRVLIFSVLVFAVSLVSLAGDGLNGKSAIVTWLIITAAYLAFDVAYVFMTMVRPLHPRVDRLVLPGSLAFALASIFAPIVIVGVGVNVVSLWVAALAIMICILGARFALLMTSANR